MCNCLEEANKTLSERGCNTQIKIPFFIDDSKPRAIIATVKEDSNVRKKPSILFATYCPLCGIEYDAQSKCED